MENYDINGMVTVNGKTIRYTACVADRFSAMLDNEHAIGCAIVLDAIGAGKIKSEECKGLLDYAMNTMDNIEKLIEHMELVKNPRKSRTMSEEAKRASYEKQLLKLKERYGVKD